MHFFQVRLKTKWTKCYLCYFLWYYKIVLPDHDCVVDAGRGQDVVEGSPSNVEDVTVVASKRGPKPPVLDVNLVGAAEDGPSSVGALLPDHDLGLMIKMLIALAAWVPDI